MLSTIRHAWNRLLIIARPFREYDGRWRAFALFGVIVGLVLSVSGLNVGNSYINRNFMNALEQRNTAEFAVQAAWYVSMFAAITAVQVMLAYCEQRLGLMLREGLTRHLIGRY